MTWRGGCRTARSSTSGGSTCRSRCAATASSSARSSRRCAATPPSPTPSSSPTGLRQTPGCSPTSWPRPSCRPLRSCARGSSSACPTTWCRRLFVEVDAFPLTPNRKIDRAALPRPDAAAAVASAEYVAPARRRGAGRGRDRRRDARRGARWAPTTTSSSSAATRWHATSVLAKVESTFGVAIELRSFFTAPTVAAVAATLTGDPATRAARRARRRAARAARLDVARRGGGDACGPAPRRGA